ncbi:MAG TPA: DNA-directed RNA polymerase subunit alpha [Defluviitoga sp.]|nr:DNA-directed RNA polymerase subunit alpha [Defluviitoga sp.]HOP25154.1 DNA-directed RNA polymerase subunit alpha [Defluviitoga sp.]HPZ28354.1 DNA-directed RNA polymerase subunit alpha [Defluviitoga sp.]HQD62244.1 DNA-directed RNA polymerase subunit alpha [Defluviitoga sp.]
MELLIKPEKFRIAEKREENDYNYTRYELYPLEKGYAVTIGNALRRVLLSSIPSLAITGLRIPGKLHEYDTIDGIKEDILEISLNLKKVQLKVDNLEKLKNIDYPILLTLRKKYKAKDVIKAGDIKTPTSIEIANPDLIIAHINKDLEVDFELYAQAGKGFVPAQELSYQSDIEYIFIDGVFSPVLKVNYLTENIRVGRRTDYDKLILEIWTKKNLTPNEALKEATETLMEHFDFIAQLWNREGKMEELESSEIIIEENDEREELEEEEDIFGFPKELLDTPIDSLDLTKRAKNCLKREKIDTLRDLLKKRPEDLLKIKNFGKKSMEEVRKELKEKFDIDYDKLYEDERGNDFDEA